jgi:hypothetical protein
MPMTSGIYIQTLHLGLKILTKVNGGGESMNAKKNNHYILNAAKQIIQENNSLLGLKNSTSYDPIEQMKEPLFFEKKHTSLDNNLTQLLKIINKTIIEAKESICYGDFNENSKNIEDLKKDCIEKEIFRREDLVPIKEIKELLLLLQKHRKKLKANLVPKEQDEIPSNDPFHEFIWNTNQYTIQKLSEEFSCSKEKISKQFIQSKKNLCCSKIEYLLSQYNYCETLYQQLEEINIQNNFKLDKNDLPNVKKGIKLNFDQVSEIAEEAIDNEFPDFNHNTVILGTLAYFNDRVVKDIDIYCNKVDLTNIYLNSLEKSKDMVHLVSK